MLRPCRQTSMLGSSCFSIPWILFWYTNLITVMSFNLEPESAQIFTDPSVGQFYWGRDSYFGYSVALHNNYEDNTNWLLIGAPRANSSHRSARNIIEPGAIFKCDLQRFGIPCHEIKLEDNQRSIDYIAYRDNGWLGAAMDSQPNYRGNRKATVVCAPRWQNHYYYDSRLMNGMCYWLNSSLADNTAHKMLPLLDYSRQTLAVNGQNLYNFYLGQAGISIHFPDNNKEMLMGAPGIFNWQGSVIRSKDEDIFASVWNARQGGSITSEKQMFSSHFVPNPYYTNDIEDFDLNGYSVTSGKFFSTSERIYVSGAPRGASLHGKVIIFKFPDLEYRSFKVLAQWKGSQLGENFGAALVSADLNGDGFTDLVVGSPTFSGEKKPDMGKIQVFLSNRISGIQPISSHSGSEKPFARFGATLASTGDINRDGYEDIAVGAPWEDDGKGAVYIYQGTAFGLRKNYTQHLTPHDFPQHLSLKGFGTSFSRGIDIDRNGYPDLAIGSFTSGHAIVLRSRAVASLNGQLRSDPPGLALTETEFTLLACLTYNGYRVPQNVDVVGRIILDSGHPSPRVVFPDRKTIKNLSMKGQTRNPQCQQFSVEVRTLALDVTRPISVKFEYEIEDIKGKRLSLPMTDSQEPKSVNLPIRIMTDCEDDGDHICKIDMHVQATFKNHREGQQLVIGSNTQPEMEITVNNFGESVFLPNVSIKVPKPFALFLPTSHGCDFTEKDDRSELVCQLINPLGKDITDIVNVIIDARQVTDASTELKVDVHVSGEGVEIQADDNFLSKTMKLVANADLKLTGYSRSEQVMYPRLDEDTINTTLSTLSFTHFYTVVKSGPTPIDKVEFTVDFPVNFTNGPNFITLYAPKTNFLNQAFLCSVQGAPLKAENSGTGESGTEITFNGTLPTSNDGDGAKGSLPGPRETSKTPSQTFLRGKQSFSCFKGNVFCAQLRCSITSWPEGLHNAEFTIRMDVNLQTLADYISVRDGATLSSTGSAWIILKNKDLAFHGDKNTTTTVTTYLLPLSPPDQGIPWWIILVAILAGLLLLILLALAMYKLGFFRRKEQEEMKAHQAQIHSHNNYGATTKDE